MECGGDACELSFMESGEDDAGLLQQNGHLNHVF